MSEWTQWAQENREVSELKIKAADVEMLNMNRIIDI